MPFLGRQFLKKSVSLFRISINCFAISVCPIPLQNNLKIRCTIGAHSGFFSVNDQFDSFYGLGAAGSIEVGFKNIIYEAYSKDSQQKV